MMNYQFDNLDGNFSNCFTRETEEIIGSLLRKIINNENKVEIWRTKLNKLQMFSIKNIFNKIIDKRMPDLKFAFITKMDLNYYFGLIENMTYNNIIIKGDIDTVVQLFDKDRDGKISYEEVILKKKFLIFFINLF